MTAQPLGAVEMLVDPVMQVCLSAVFGVCVISPIHSVLFLKGVP